MADTLSVRRMLEEIKGGNEMSDGFEIVKMFLPKGAAIQEAGHDARINKTQGSTPITILFNDKIATQLGVKHGDRVVAGLLSDGRFFAQKNIVGWRVGKHNSKSCPYCVKISRIGCNETCDGVVEGDKLMFPANKFYQIEK